MSDINVLWYKFKLGFCEVDFLCERAAYSIDLNWLGWLVLTVLGVPVVTIVLAVVIGLIARFYEELQMLFCGLVILFIVIGIPYALLR